MGAKEKSAMLLSQNWKNLQFDSKPKIISHFGGTNNIFVDFTYIIEKNKVGAISISNNPNIVYIIVIYHKPYF